MFAERVGLKPGALAYYEKGQRFPRADDLRAICLATGISADWLLFGGETSPPATPAPSAKILGLVGDALAKTFGLTVPCGHRFWLLFTLVYDRVHNEPTMAHKIPQIVDDLVSLMGNQGGKANADIH